MVLRYLGTKVDSEVIENLDKWSVRGKRSALVNFLLLEGFARSRHLEFGVTVEHEDSVDGDIDLVVSVVHPARGEPETVTHELAVGSAILVGVHRVKASRCSACASLKERLRERLGGFQ